MSIELHLDPELRAKKAERLIAFGGLNLLHIKRSVAVLLGQIGKGGIFDEYTRHDITHIEAMLGNLEWIIPEQTKQLMSDADWLMIVLAVYFHDLGMLVTKEEFRLRADSGFPRFCEQVLFAGASGPDYRAKIDKLTGEDRERFLYQEFVRSKHAERIRAWIMGQAASYLGISESVVKQLTALLEPIGPQFRRDLGIICESHHLNDLNDLQKYKVAQPYGNSEAETANLQYCAVLLRTADLLHLTSDRTPSIEFRTINPNDPLSQQEWSRHMAVKRVKAKVGSNEDGLPDEAAPRDTVEVHAFFTQEDGFFGLTSYLGYATDQLKKNNEWISHSVRQRLAKHEFPWRRIDDSNIETEGFIRDAFEFTIDQAKILDLLTGHTLYNDTNIVLRELVQNAIDAIRLKFFPESPVDKGRVAIAWDSKTRVLSVQDNGTGMTQEIINKFLLKVGSSRYQDPDFIKQYPGFSSISRFGIGVLSTFMIADSVEIVSCHPDEDQARRLMLRSVHGKYLIRLLGKEGGDPKMIGPHGTIFRLHVRPSVEVSDVMQNAQQWVVVPECSVTVKVDDGAAQSVGYASPADALRGFVRSSGLEFYEGELEDEAETTKRRLRIVERTQDGVTMAYALAWNKWFREWSFVATGSLPSIMRGEGGKQPPLLGICVEGIRIVNDSPGFEGFPVVALANVRGPSAPRTNVARSGLESTPERDSMLASIYSMYAQHISEELAELTSARSFSLTWAAGESTFLLDPLLGSERRESIALSRKLFKKAIGAIPCVLVEEAGKRSAQSPNALSQVAELWTIECDLLSSAESLIREVSSAASLSALVRGLNVTEFKFPSAPVVCGIRGRNDFVRAVFAGKEVDLIVVNPMQRRVDLRWVERSEPARWIDLPRRLQRIALDFAETRGRRYGYRTSRSLPKVPKQGVQAHVPSGEIAVMAFGETLLVPGTEIAGFVRQRIEAARDETASEAGLVAMTVLGLIGDQIASRRAAGDAERLRKTLREYDQLADFLQIPKGVDDMIDVSELSALFSRTNWKTYDPSVWRRSVDV